MMVAFQEAEVKKTYEQLGNYTNLANHHAQSSLVRIVFRKASMLTFNHM